MPRLVQDLFSLRGTVTRERYLAYGLVLMAAKIGLDLLVSQAWGASLPVAGYLTSWLIPYRREVPGASTGWFWSLILVALPFAWAGTVLTLKRVRHAGLHPLWVGVFYLPLLKFLLFGLLILLPEGPSSRASDPPAPPSPDPATGLDRLIPRSPAGSMLAALAITALGTVGMAQLGIYLGGYGYALFVGVPFWLGMVCTLLHGWHVPRSVGSSFQLSMVTGLLAAGLFIAFALEGLVCLVLLAPLAVGLVGLGSLIGHSILARTRWRGESPRLFTFTLLALPLCMGLEGLDPAPAPILRVTSRIVVAAPPERVWEHVVSFAELPPPREWLFRLGVAYPIRASIQGQGVGAVRHCEFSTGTFVEPITIWDAPRRLAFSVLENPPPLEEWTPYEAIHPPHLEGYLISHRGEFRLERLQDGRTLLEGSTWYEHRLWPDWYWRLWSDRIIQAIHLRVLRHIRDLSERPGGSDAPFAADRAGDATPPG